MPDSRDVFHHGDAKVGQLLLRTNARKEKQSRSIYSTGADYGLFLGGYCEFFTRLQSDVHACHSGAFHIYFTDPSVCEDGKVRSPFITAKDGMNVSYTGTAPATIIRIVRHGEKASTLLKISRFDDFFVEVVDHGDFKSGGARIHPILTKLISVPGVDGLHCVTKVVQETGKGFE